jgi:Reverse transcriptase (RNA-dependent DNA polymerase)
VYRVQASPQALSHQNLVFSVTKTAVNDVHSDAIAIDCDNVIKRHADNHNERFLTLYLLNSTSLAKPHATQLLQADLCNNNVDVAMICETWFTCNHSDEFAAVDGYTLFRRDRLKRKGGGVCFYIRNVITCSILEVPSSKLTQLEILWIKCCYESIDYYIACCYHPPKPSYKAKLLTDAVAKDLEFLLCLASNPIIFVTGDLNQLHTDFLEQDFGLTQIVTMPTHGKNIIDKVFCNRPDIFSSLVLKSLVKTKHDAVLVNDQTVTRSILAVTRKKIIVHDLRSHNIDKLRFNIGSFNWCELINQHRDVQSLYNEFMLCLFAIIDTSIPMKTVSIGPKDPEFITPLVKSLLMKRNKLRRRGELEKANDLATKINTMITENRTVRLKNMEDCSIKDLWSAVKQKNGKHSTIKGVGDADAANIYFSKISFDDNLEDINVDDFFNVDSRNDDTDDFLMPYAIEPLLGGLKSTSAGLDNLPYWLFKNCSFELAEIVAYIFKLSIKSGTVVSQWRAAVVTPIPKIPNACTLADYRPISVTPILSRILEKIIVNKFLRPALPNELIKDQFAFRPTGSTTAALVYFMHRVTSMLESNCYVRCLCIDFSKAFDVIDHKILIAKLKRLPLAPNIFNWIVSFLCQRSQVTKINGNLSSYRTINKGIVQGSGIGPTLYTIMASDLKTISDINDLFKYADDTTLLTPENTDVELSEEFDSIRLWANNNKMLINMEKTKEIVFHKPSPRSFVPPLEIEGIAQVVELKLLGVFFNGSLKFDGHLKYILGLCSQRSYLLKSLRDQGLPLDRITIIYQAIIISRLLYALPAWGGFISCDQVGQINSFLRRTFRYGYCIKQLEFKNILNTTDRKFFLKIQNNTHCVHHILPALRTQSLNLRTKGHPFQLPNSHSNLHRKSFIMRCIFNFI